MNKWPTKKQINEALDEMDSGLASRPLPAQASPVDRFKYSLCSQFVVYMNTRKISQQELAQLLGVDKSITSKIVHYHFDDFTSDRLIKYLSILDPDVKIEVKAKVAQEIGCNGFTYKSVSDKEDTVVMDQAVEYLKDPKYLRNIMLFKMTVEAQNRIKKLAVSKREIIRRMGTTPTQVYRLMDQTNTHKTIDQMLRLLAALDCSVEIKSGDWAAQERLKALLNQNEESRVSVPDRSVGNQTLHNGVFEMAVAYLYHLLQNYPFIDGNKRVGLASAVTFLGLNGLELDPTLDKASPASNFKSKSTAAFPRGR